MKRTLIIILLIYSHNSFSQSPDPNLLQIWYLHNRFSSDDNITHPISAINPPISPYILFTEELNISGQGNCNTYNGTFELPYPGFLRFHNFTSTTNPCAPSNEDLFESSFFGIMQNDQEYQFDLFGEGDNMRLVLFSPIFAVYVFYKYPLLTRDFILEQSFVYPNPVSSKLFISSPGNIIDEVEIINSLGQSIKKSNNNNIIDTSDFSKGVYFIRLISGNKSVVKKIIKS